jgi:hypothetical protein
VADVTQKDYYGLEVTDTYATKSTQSIGPYRVHLALWDVFDASCVVIICMTLTTMVRNAPDKHDL